MDVETFNKIEEADLEVKSVDEFGHWIDFVGSEISIVTLHKADGSKGFVFFYNRSSVKGNILHWPKQKIDNTEGVCCVLKKDHNLSSFEWHELDSNMLKHIKRNVVKQSFY